MVLWSVLNWLIDVLYRTQRFSAVSKAVHLRVT